MAEASKILEELRTEEARLRKGIRVTTLVYAVLIILSIASTTFTSTRIQAETAPDVAAEQAAAIIEHIATQVRVDMIRDLRERSQEWPGQAASQSRLGVARLDAMASRQVSTLVDAATAPQQALIAEALQDANSASVDEVLSALDAQAPAIIAAALSAKTDTSAITQARRQVAMYWLLTGSDERSAVAALFLHRMADGLQKLLAEPAETPE
jgi:hypothetical protein